MMVKGLSGMLQHLGMLEGKPAPARQIDFDTKARRELRPRVSGYLVSHFENPEDLGKLVKGGSRLGEVVDVYTYDVIEKIDAPFDGYLFSRAIRAWSAPARRRSRWPRRRSRNYRTSAAVT